VTRTDAVKALHYEYVSRVHAAIGAQEQLRATWCSGATRCCCFDFYFLPQHTVHMLRYNDANDSRGLADFRA